MSIRLRLALIFSVILALTLIVSGALLYVSVSQLTLGVQKDALEDDHQAIATSRGFEIDQIEMPRGKPMEPGTLAQTRATDGTIVDGSDNLGDVELPLSEDRLEDVLNGEASTQTIVIDGDRHLVYSKRVYERGETIGILQVAQSLAETDQTLTTLRNSLLVGIVAVTLAAFGLGWVMAGTALRPIDRIGQAAKRIGDARDFRRRIDDSGPRDEIGRLVNTINGMLAELEAAHNQTERALVAQRRFVADASHELRTPLTTIRGNLDLLQREPPIPADDQAAVLVDISGETERLIRLANDLLTLERADAAWPLPEEPTPIRPVIDEAVRQARALDPDREIVVDEIPDVAISANRDAIKQTLLILLDNAIKHTPTGTPVGVAASATATEASVSVRDQGPGIPAEAAPQLFERFYRGADQRSGAGVGLGLAIARALVESQRGRISVDSQPDRGSTFTVTFARATAGAS
ncbi:MAG TPA: HAMP domain-containing sensor histidine kinase [Thermomicrobiales bacterium]|nr:HAMP domain-containing sensor histidine kinase [Thermomicrobiales bacterium]